MMGILFIVLGVGSGVVALVLGVMSLNSFRDHNAPASDLHKSPNPIGFGVLYLVGAGACVAIAYWTLTIGFAG